MRWLPLLLLLLPSISWGAEDLNGYEAQYECRAGGPHCNVDVEALAGPSSTCDQIITPADSWGTINWANDVICLAPGDHTGKGRLTTQGNGSAGNYKVLRYWRSNDLNDDPWEQGGNQAKLDRLRVEGDFWIIHRLTFPSTTSNFINRVTMGETTEVNNIIISRVLVEGPGLSDVCQGGIVTSSNTNVQSNNITVQNSVLRGLLRCDQGLSSPVALDISAGTDHHIVNNEAYNWCEHTLQVGNNNIPEMPGLVVENNDFYSDSAVYLSSGDAASGAPISVKLRGTPSSPALVIQNRVWGMRKQDGNECGTPGAPFAIVSNANSGSDNEYVIIKNNIVFDSIGGVSHYNFTLELRSIVGNIFYDITPKGTIDFSRVLSFFSGHRMEVYFNTIVGARRGSADGIFGEWTGATNLDIRCNVVVDSDGITNNPGSGSDVDFNVFYDTPEFTFGASSTNISRGIITRANSTFYSAGTIMRRTSNMSACTSGGDADCFLYLAMSTGTTGPSSPAFTTILGDTFQDGSVTWQAVRGPHTFFRKLRTAPEEFSIPYAAPSLGTPEVNFCPSSGESFATGSRTGIGVNNEVAPNGIFATDMTGTPR